MPTAEPTLIGGRPSGPSARHRFGVFERWPAARSGMTDASCPHQRMCSTLPAHLHFHAVAAFSGLAALRAFTINHRNAGLASLQDLSIDSDAAVDLHEAMWQQGAESVVLRTCNRTELYWRARVPGDDEKAAAALARTLGVQEASLQQVASHLVGDAAVTHLFRVCCGLESLVIGEAEILGQVRAALDACTHSGPFLDGVFRAALRAAGMARTETAIGVGARSVASMAVHWLADVMPLAGRRVLVIGAGETGRKAARQLLGMGVGRLVIANRTVSRAEALARPLGASATGLDTLAEEIAEADAVVCAACGADWLVRLDDLRPLATRGRPLAIADLAMPAAVEPGEIDGITRMDLRRLEHLVEAHRRQREDEIPRVEAVIERELAWLRSWARHHALRPLMADLRRKVEAIRRAELARELGSDGAIDAAALERLSRRLLDQILAIPLARLASGDVPIDATQAEYLKRLFALEAP